MRRYSIVGAAMGALGAALSGVGHLVADESSSVRPRRQNGVTWGRGRLTINTAKEENRQLTNDERKQLGLPHDGAKQTEKDRRRPQYEEHAFRDIGGWSKSNRPSPIACRLPSPQEF